MIASLSPTTMTKPARNATTAHSFNSKLITQCEQTGECHQFRQMLMLLVIVRVVLFLLLLVALS